jgi:predicted dehydrogenase
MKSKMINRRSFVRNSIAAMAAAAAAPSIVPSRVFGANDKIAIGGLGVGRRGGQILDEIRGRHSGRMQIVAVADCDKARADAMAKRYGAEAHSDYHELLARKDVDAVMIASPDHWHELHTIHAAQAGKDIFCEKPMSFTIQGSRKMVEAVRKYNVVFQTGAQQRSMRDNYIACMLVRNGFIGKVEKVIASNYPSPWICDLPGQPVPAGLDWDAWCGCAEITPYHPDVKAPRANPGWISFQRFSTGEMGGWGAHGFDQIQWALGTDDTAPVEIWTEGPAFDPPVFKAPAGRAAAEDQASKPKVFMRYASGVVMELGNANPGGGTIIGEKGTIKIARASVQSDPYPMAARIRAEYIKGNTAVMDDLDVQLYRSNDHIGNWLDCIRSRKDPVSPVEVGHHSSVVIHLGNIARWAGRRLQFDPAKEVFVGDDDANKYLDVARRAGYELPKEV